jgi:hypothetical protein
MKRIKMEPQVFVVGCAAGFSGDRPEAALPLVQTLIDSGQPALLFFEVLAERTLALAQLAKRQDSTKGCEQRLEAFLEPVIGRCLAHNIPIVGNFGAANPQAAAKRIAALARRLNLGGVKIGVVEGDDLLQVMSPKEIRKLQINDSPGLFDREMVSANAYLGGEPIAEALESGANVIVTGRVSDPALTLGPLVHHFNWAWNDWDLLSGGTIAGHLLECATQVSGGYFADPGVKDVPDLAWVGCPFAEVHSDGTMVIGKAAKTGGLVSRATVTEQLLYEIHDPSAYVTPDVIVDITEVSISEIGRNRVSVKGARGKPRPDQLKVTVGFEDGWLGEGEISYSGPNALERARLACSLLRERMERYCPDCQTRTDIIGGCSVFNDDAGRALMRSDANSQDFRVRLAVHSNDRVTAERAGYEVLALYTCGPAGGGGVRTALTPRLATASAFVHRKAVSYQVSFLEIHNG